MNTHFHIILYQPEIPPNTGNILRLCAATGCRLHLIGPLGFRLDAASVRRAGMDYRAWADVERWMDWPSYLQAHPTSMERTFMATTKGYKTYTAPQYQSGDRFLFGSESSGLPETLRANHSENLIRIPMAPQARSLNLANSVGIILYEALRQVAFPELI